MALFLDFFVIAVFGISLFVGIKRGFVRSIMGIAVALLALFGSIKLTPAFASYLKDRYIEKSLTSKVQESLGRLISGMESIDLKKLFEEKPTVFTDILDRFGADFESVKAFFENRTDKEEQPPADGETEAGETKKPVDPAEGEDTVNPTETVSDTEAANDAETAEEAVSRYIVASYAEKFSRVIAFILLFIGLVIVLTLLVMLLDLVMKLPVLNEANKILGAIFGAVMGIAYAWGYSLLFCYALPLLATMYEGSIPEAVIENTVIVKFLGSIDIFHLF